MRTITVTISDETEAQLQRHIDQYGERDLSSIVQDALQQYLPEPRVWRGIRYRPAQRGPFRVTPAEVGSGESDISLNHDEHFADVVEERAFSERNRTP